MSSIRLIAVKCAALGLVGLALLGLLYNTMSAGVDGGMSRYQAEFTEVSGLRVGDDVRIAGVKVGQVADIDIEGDQARVDFTLSEKHPLTTTTGLVLRYQNLIGQRYLAVAPGARPGSQLAAGSTIPISMTSPGFDLTSLLNGFRPLFAVLSPQDINSLSESIIKVLQGEGGTVSELLGETTRLTNYLSDREALFHEVASNLTPVLHEISGSGSQLESTVTRLSQLTRGLAEHRRTMGSSIDELARLVGRTNEMVTEIRAPLRRDIEALRQVTQLYAVNSELYGPSFQHFGSILAALGRAMSYRSAANELICTVRLRSGSTEVLVGSPNDPKSEVCR